MEELKKEEDTIYKPRREMMNCERCGIEVMRKAYNQKYCARCNGEAGRDRAKLKRKTEVDGNKV